MSELVYKYFPWKDYTKDALEKRYFWFSKPKNFNDPFDSNMDILGVSEKLSKIFSTKFSEDKTLLEFVKKTTNDYGILCLTKPTKKKGSIGDKGFNNLHFWSHYTNNYKGICIGYKEEEIKNYYSEKLQSRCDLLPVEYFNNSVDLEGLDFKVGHNKTKKIEGIFGQYPDVKEIDAFFKQILLFKDGRIWAKENEHRIILAEGALDNLKNNPIFQATNFEIIDSTNNGYKLPYPDNDIIEEVTFGVNFDKAGIDEAVSLISANNNNVKFYTTKLDFRNADVEREPIQEDRVIKAITR